MKNKLMQFVSNMGKLNKVAEIIFIFWLMKIVATMLRETMGDYLSMTLNLDT
jgi:uncharacterized membrane-anchored protein